MGTINGNYESKNITPETLLYGDNEFETAVVTVAASGSLTNGACLTRGENGKYTVVSGSEETPVDLTAVYTGETLTNTDTSNAKDFAVRVVISGRLNKNLVTVGGDAITDAQADMLRNYNILALPTRIA